MVRIGETFKYKNKVYAAVLTCDGCKGCAFNKGLICLIPPLNKLTENCNEKNNTIGATIIFKEVKKYMEIKNNQLTIDIPEGHIIDVEHSDLSKGIIKFKKSDITYKDIEDALNLEKDLTGVACNTNNVTKLSAIDKLINIANYYNKGWKPDWNNKYELKYCISFTTITNSYDVACRAQTSIDTIYFKHMEDVEAVINNLNFRGILDTIYKN